jgi:hypothetical protein
MVGKRALLRVRQLPGDERDYVIIRQAFGRVLQGR